MPQNVALIEGSLLQNITLEHDVNLEKRNSAADSLRQVGLSHLLAADESGLNSLVGSDLFLSGGERQRLGFARVLFSDSKIIYLDEPTSSLDEISESDIFDLIIELAESRIVILVTHSLNANRKFPNVMTLT